MAVYTEQLRELIAGVLEDHGYDVESMTMKQALTTAAPLIFEDDIPFFDEDYRLPLETKILRHYYMREIGQETEDAFIFYLNRDMQEQMPYFNKLYKSELYSFDPLIGENRTVKHTGTRADNRNSNAENEDQSVQATRSEDERKQDTQSVQAGKSEDTKESHDKQSGAQFNSEANKSKGDGVSSTDADANSRAGVLDTPQGALTGLQDAMDIMGGSATTATGGYLTNAQLSESKSGSNTASHNTAEDTKQGQTVNSQNTDGNEKSNGKSDIAQASNTKDNGKSEGTQSGYTKSKGKASEGGNSADFYLDEITARTTRPAEAIMEFRKTFLNIDEMVIKTLNVNFMGIY